MLGLPRRCATRGISVVPWLLPLLVSACGAEDDPVSQFVSSEELFVSGGDGSGFGRITALAVDEYDRAYVADRLNGTVHVLGRDGTPVRSLGRPGDGPGELQNPLGLAFGPDGKLWIVDVGRSRYVVYDTTGSFVAEWPREISGWGWPWDGGFDAQGLLCDAGVVVGPRPIEAIFCRQIADQTLGSMDTLSLPPVEPTAVEILSPAGRYSAGLPHTRRREAYITGGRLWIGFTDRYWIVTVDPVGPRRVVERDVAPDPLPPLERAAIVDSLAALGAERNDVEERLPRSRAMFETFVSDASGRLWVLRSDPAERMTIDLFNTDGSLLGSLAADIDASPRPVVRSRSLWGVRSDPLDIQRVVRLRVDELW